MRTARTALLSAALLLLVGLDSVAARHLPDGPPGSILVPRARLVDPALTPTIVAEQRWLPLDYGFRQRLILAQQIAAEQGIEITFNSLFRSQSEQDAMQARWDRGDQHGLVTRPANVSQHSFGFAADVRPRNADQFQAWAEALTQAGLHLPLILEDPVHVEPRHGTALYDLQHRATPVPPRLTYRQTHRAFYTALQESLNNWLMTNDMLMPTALLSDEAVLADLVMWSAVFSPPPGVRVDRELARGLRRELVTRRDSAFRRYRRALAVRMLQQRADESEVRLAQRLRREEDRIREELLRRERDRQEAERLRQRLEREREARERADRERRRREAERDAQRERQRAAARREAQERDRRDREAAMALGRLAAFERALMRMEERRREEEARRRRVEAQRLEAAEARRREAEARAQAAREEAARILRQAMLELAQWEREERARQAERERAERERQNRAQERQQAPVWSDVDTDNWLILD